MTWTVYTATFETRTIMTAIVEIAGGQFRVQEGDVIKTELLHQEEGAAVEFDSVLLVTDDSATKVGTPFVEGARVTAEVVSNGRHPKVEVYHYLPKSKWKKTQGHRQGFTELKVTAVSG